jgi:predicted TIM-barrel fold metal-dependent hydrolase
MKARVQMNKGIIDAHNHPNWHGHDIDKIIQDMDEKGIEKMWLLSWDATMNEMEVIPHNYEAWDPRGICAPLWEVLEGLKKYPDRFIGGWAPNPRDRFARAKLKAAVAIHGIRIYGELKYRLQYDCPDAIAMYRYCAELGLPVVFHLECPSYLLDTYSKNNLEWPEWYGGNFSVVEKMCELCPDTIFIGHASGFWREISGDADETKVIYPNGPVTSGGKLPDLLRKYKNLYGDISASGSLMLKRDLKFTRQLFIEFQDQILFGRDQFTSLQFDLLESLYLPEDVLTKVCRLNAERVLIEAEKGKKG